MRIKTLSLVSFAFATLAGFACSDSSTLATAPRQVSFDAQLLGGLIGDVLPVLGEVLVAPVHRNTPLASPVVWSFTVGPNGGSSSNSATGLTVSVPQGAVANSVTITVTALPGTALAYGFEPHGLEFMRKVQLTQHMNGTSAGLLTMLAPSGAHFSGEVPTFVDGLALVNELVNARINLLQNTVSFPITHFSGWIVATGRSSQGSGETQ